MQMIALRIVGGKSPCPPLRQIANHHLQSLIDLRPSWRFAALTCERSDEHDLPFRTCNARLFSQRVKASEIFWRLVDTHERGQNASLAVRMARLLLKGGMVWDLRRRKEEEEPLGLTLRNRGSQ